LKPIDIEKKVIEALQKDYLAYLNIKKLTLFYDEEGK